MEWSLHDVYQNDAYSCLVEMPSDHCHFWLKKKTNKQQQQKKLNKLSDDSFWNFRQEE